jgi:hypothetical protein
LEEPLRDIAFLASLRLQSWFFKNGHECYPRAAVAA